MFWKITVDKNTESSTIYLLHLSFGVLLPLAYDIPKPLSYKQTLYDASAADDFENIVAKGEIAYNEQLVL